MHPCPTCGNSRRVRRRDIGRMKQCRRCHLSQIAPKGYAATREKHGEHFAIRFMRLYRLDNPSNLERIVTTWLDGQGVGYEREFTLFQTDHVFLVDFLIGSRCIAVEVNGDYVHSHHAERDRQKVEALRSAGFEVVVLSEADVLSGTFASRLESAL